MAVAKSKRETAEDRRQFEQLHHEGAKQFGGLWLQANESAINTLRHCSLNPEQNKLLGSLIAMRLCTYWQLGYRIGIAEKGIANEEHF